MAQCSGRNQRTGERCGRTAPAGSSTCHYHGPDAAKKAVARRLTRAEKEAVDLTSGPAAFTTKELSERTFDDFETLFAEGTGWGRCGCLWALQARRVTGGATWAEQREVNLATMRGLVGEGRSHGILVYADKRPAGWCQFVPREGLRRTNKNLPLSASDAAWFVTCFVVDPRYRGHGATGVALRAAVDAIGRKGGGIIEGHATAMAAGPPPRSERRDTHLEGDVLFYRGDGIVRLGVEVPGVGPVTALYRSRRAPHGGPLGGTVDLYRQAGFDAVAVRPRPAPGEGQDFTPDRIVMRRAVDSERRGSRVSR